MRGDLLGFLECPHCRGVLRLDGDTVRCGNRHAFDVARQGHVSLLTGAAVPTGDTASMVAARSTFLGAGHYDPIVQAVCAAAEPALARQREGCVVDVGAGTGHHLAAVLDRVPQRRGIALDSSKYAARRAARAHPRLGAVVCDVWRRLPVRTGAAALVLDVFAPRNAAEIRRVLRPAGALVVVTPTSRHLTELVGAIGLLSVDERKQQRLDEQLGPPARTADCEYRMALPHGAVEALAAMGPAAWHTTPEALRERVRALPDPVTVTASVTVSAYLPTRPCP
ncbi:MAG: methyltransferase domain-containing protein [Pseudonocardiaceae bacterium]|nr:methyltransferase domain-containing protein [Pseudonocardiaceae bacterium]